MLESFSWYFFAGKWGKTIIILTIIQNQNMGAHGIKIEYRHKHKLIELIMVDTYLTDNNNNNNNNNNNFLKN